MRVLHWIPVFSGAALILLTSAYYLAGAWRRAFAARAITGARVRQLSAIATNLSRILMATETESAMLNRDISKFLKIVQRHIEANVTKLS